MTSGAFALQRGVEVDVLGHRPSDQHAGGQLARSAATTSSASGDDGS
ncbi:MAG: hypothetical protein R2710_25710 [Acidimicrobiales bacterium]